MAWQGSAECVRNPSLPVKTLSMLRVGHQHTVHTSAHAETGSAAYALSMKTAQSRQGFTAVRAASEHADPAGASARAAACSHAVVAPMAVATVDATSQRRPGHQDAPAAPSIRRAAPATCVWRGLRAWLPCRHHPPCWNAAAVSRAPGLAAPRARARDPDCAVRPLPAPPAAAAAAGQSAAHKRLAIVTVDPSRCR